MLFDQRFARWETEANKCEGGPVLGASLIASRRLNATGGPGINTSHIRIFHF